MAGLDLLDRRILYELDLNARASASEIAKKLRRSKETINFRINRLLKEKYIKGFSIVFNSSKIGTYYYKLYVKFKNITPQRETELFRYLLNQRSVSYLADVEGFYDCLLLVQVKNADEMTKFLDKFMKNYGEYIQQKDMMLFLTVHRFNQRFLYNGVERKDWFYPVPLGNYLLDPIDKKIAEILSGNARVPLTEIARGIGIDPKSVKYRLKKLEKDEMILAYVTLPNFDRLGLQFIQINFSFRDPTIKPSVIEYFNSTNKCLFAIELLGKYDLLVEVHVKDNDELRRIIDGFRDKFVGYYNDYDIHTINKEYAMEWGPFSETR
jgi:DNA-binding Lrp family transcriptional regulator